MPAKTNKKRPKGVNKPSHSVERRRLTDLLHKRWFKWAVIPAVSLILLSLIIVLLGNIIFQPVKNYNFGVSFSARQSEKFGLDWQDNFTALLDDLGIRHYRLMSYWDEHEAQRGQFDFSRLDWQMDEAAKRGAKVSLAIGERQPRWPECHHPRWANELQGHEWKQALYAYIEVVVNRYKDHPALESWQLENEYFNNWFGDCPDFDRQRFEEEYALVKRLSNKPIWNSLADQHGLPIRGETPDAYGYSVYRFVYDDKYTKQYIWYPTPLWYHRARTEAIKIYRPEANFFVHELQLEPWGAVDTKYMTIEEQDASMNPEQIHSNVTFARRIGFKDIYAWGGEWWYWRKVAYNDPAAWEAVRQEVDLSREP